MAEDSISQSKTTTSPHLSSRAVASSRKKTVTPIALGPEFPKPQIVAADPVKDAITLT